MSALYLLAAASLGAIAGFLIACLCHAASSADTNKRGGKP